MTFDEARARMVELQLHLHASEDIGGLAGTFVRSRAFRRNGGGLLQRAFGRLAEGERPAKR